MSNLFNNAWVVGIGGGILSGIIVAWLSRLFFSKRDDREFLEKVSTANREILYAVRPGVAEGVVPVPDVLESLIAATARKYRLRPQDIYTPRDILDDLIKEVMDSSFISASAKAEFCSKLSSVLRPQAEVTPISATEFQLVQEEVPRMEYRQRWLSMTSMMLGIMTALMTAVITLFVGKESILQNVKSDQLTLALPALVGIATLLTAMVVFLSFRIFLRPRAILRDEKHDEKSDGDKT